MPLTRNRAARIHPAHCRCRACLSPHQWLQRVQGAAWAPYRGPIILVAAGLVAAVSGWSVWELAGAAWEVAR